MSKFVKATSLLLATMSLSAMAKVNCEPFKAEADMKADIVNNFNETIIKLETKAQQMQIKVEDRLAMISTVDGKIQNTQAAIEQIKQDSQNIRISMRDIKASLDSALATEQDLISQISSLDYQIRTAPAGSNARRAAMREKKRTEKKLEKLSQTISQIQYEIAPMQDSLQSLKMQKQDALAVLAQLDSEKIEIENMRPTLDSLIRKKNKAQDEVAMADQSQEANIAQMEEANEKVLMCKTYNVKYPVSLEVSKELYTVGCENYQLKGYKGPFKKMAEQETLNAVCN